jgi:hypothetical protein
MLALFYKFFDILVATLWHTRHWAGDGEIQSERLATIRRSLHFPLLSSSTVLGSAALLGTPLIFEGCSLPQVIWFPCHKQNREGTRIEFFFSIIIIDFDLLVRLT